jgi:hypothetical protein
MRDGQLKMKIVRCIITGTDDENRNAAENDTAENTVGHIITRLDYPASTSRSLIVLDFKLSSRERCVTYSKKARVQIAGLQILDNSGSPVWE